ncbi:TMEM143 family protein [Congregibacter sp.]|uniref:TMEM143 family protein n=1 Tax=Congregibacter sp. TaxID=2744308 RepID=UPI0039E64BFE
MSVSSAQESVSDSLLAEKAVDEPLVTPLAGFRFIPFRRSDLLQMLRSEARLGPAQERRFEGAVLAISENFRNDFHDSRQALKDLYADLDPDADTRQFPDSALPQDEAVKQLTERLAFLLNRANYEELSEGQLKKAFRSKSLFQIRLRVDLKDFGDVMLFCRGSSERTATVKLLFGLIKRQVRFLNYERVVLFLRFADRGAKTDSEFTPGRVMIKLFQNVPDADLEMLFPNTRVAMRWTDRLLIGIPALASGAIVATTKLGAPLLLLGALGGFWLGLHSEPVALDKRGLLVIGAGIAALGVYLWKQWSSYRNRKERFRQALTRDLYFKLLDNNAGVLLRVLDDAEDSECKEAFVALYFLLAEARALSAKELDSVIEDWFALRWYARLDFEIEDALKKLEYLALAEEHDGLWNVSVQTSTSVVDPS